MKNAKGKTALDETSNIPTTMSECATALQGPPCCCTGVAGPTLTLHPQLSPCWLGTGLVVRGPEDKEVPSWDSKQSSPRGATPR